MPDIEDIAPAQPTQRPLGTMAGEIEIIGDIVGPIGAFDETQTLLEWDEMQPQPQSPFSTAFPASPGSDS